METTLNSKSKILIGVVVGIHLLLALIYSGITPYRTAGILKSQGSQVIPDIGAPDERAHADYVDSILTGKGLPFLDINRMTSDKDYRRDEYENHQPPLYYGIEAAAMFLTGTKNMDSPSMGVHARFLNAIIGATTIAGVFFLAWWGFKRADIGLIAATFASLLPMNVALSCAVSNDPLLICLMTWVLALVVKSVVEGWTMRQTFLIALLCGLSVLTKSSGLAIIPIVVVAIFLTKTTRPTGKLIALSSAIFLVLTTPLFVRNQVIYGDPLALNAFNRAFKDTASRVGIEKIIRAQDGNPPVDYWTSWVGWWTARSFIGAFGYMDIWMNEEGLPYPGPRNPNVFYRLVYAGLVICFFGWVLAQKEEWQKERKDVNIVLGLFTFLTFALFIRFNLQFFQAQGRYLMPAIAPIAVGVGIGVAQGAKKYRTVCYSVFVIAMLVIQGNALRTISTEFPLRSVGVSLNSPSIPAQQSLDSDPGGKFYVQITRWCRWS